MGLQNSDAQEPASPHPPKGWESFKVSGRVECLEAQALAVTDDLIQPAGDDLLTVFLALLDELLSAS